MQNHDLDFWLKHIRTLHAKMIDYSLQRIRNVAERLEVLHPQVPVIMVTGTNGKGSTVAAMEAILLASNHRVGSFTSPYLINFNEQIRLSAVPVDDATLVQAFATIEQVRGDISLSEFEFTTLAALIIFKNAPLDIILFEVGLGGGQDATNIIDAEVTIITSLALDHEEYLGTTLDEIAAAEAQLLRADKKGIIGAARPPQPLIDYAKKINCKLFYLEQDFYFVVREQTWSFWNNATRFDNLPLPLILCKNAALALQTLLTCGVQLSQADIVKGLSQISLQGRLQFKAGKPSLLLDVAHNPEAIANLREYLAHLAWPGNVIAVFSMLKDKKISETIKLIAPYVREWLVAPIEHPRGASMTQLVAAFQDAGVTKVTYFQDLALAMMAAKKIAGTHDLVLMFGSFFVVRVGLDTLIYRI